MIQRSLRTSQDQLKEDLCAFLVLSEYSHFDLGEPTCPLCNDPWADYRRLTNEEIQHAWKAAAEEVNQAFDAGLDPQAPCWKGISCCENWSEAREALERSRK